MSSYRKKLTVNVDCVIMVNNNDGLIFTIGNTPFFGPLWRVWSLIVDVAESKKAIYNTYKINVPKIALSNVEQDEKALIRESLLSGDIIFDYDAQGYQDEARIKGNVINTIMETKPLITDMWNNFQNYLELLYTSLGINHNPNNAKKERQINIEVQSNNQLLTSQIKTELEVREQQIKILNEIFKTEIVVELSDIFIENDSQNLGDENE